MHHHDPDRPFTCVTCEVDIVGPPVVHVGLPFCCAGCVAGGPCTCSYDLPVSPSMAAIGALVDRPVAADTTESHGRPVPVGSVAG